MTTSSPTIKPSWYRAFSTPAREFPPTDLELLAGSIPAGLCGTLYRNGPGRLERGGRQVGHWFDGDGAILAVKFADGAASGVYRYIQTAGYQAESQAERFLYANYGMTAPGKIWERWGKPVKSTGNTSVIALPDRLLALWEGGCPHALDLDTLATIGTDDLGFVSFPFTYSAHPKVDPISGHIYNFGISIGASTNLNLYQSDRTGKIIDYSQTKLSKIPLIHDFLLVDRYLVICIPPVTIKPFPVLLGLNSYSDSMQWQPELGTQILVFDRSDLSLVSRATVEPWFQWHFGNGCLDLDGNIVCDLVRYADFDSNQFFKEIPTGTTQTESIGNLWQLVIDPQSGKLISSDRLIDRSCEFPVVSDDRLGREWRYTYLAAHRSDTIVGKELVGTIGRFDRHENTLTLAEIDRGLYPSEPIHIVDKFDESQSWIITVIYDSNRDRSEVWIYASNRLNEPPVCRLALPSVIPMGFHGTWKNG